MSNTYYYAMAVNVAKESSYAYNGTQRLCARSPLAAGPYRVKNFGYTTLGDCTALFNRVTSGPVVVGVAVGSSTGFMNYNSGILSLTFCP